MSLELLPRAQHPGHFLFPDYTWSASSFPGLVPTAPPAKMLVLAAFHVAESLASFSSQPNASSSKSTRLVISSKALFNVNLTYWLVYLV
jgi:hypothetical protein